jgi:adenosylcobinamide-GDP ribazoletransferase
MTSFLLALQFLTIIPVRVRHFQAEKMARAAICFPVVGCLLGIFLSLLYYASLGWGFSSLTTAAVCVITLIVLTGGMHLDGLADTIDALAGSKDRDARLAIMRDPAIGALGATGLICAIILKIVVLAELPQQLAPIALIPMTTFSRWSQVLVMTCFPYARQKGKASVFSQGMSRRLFLAATMLALIPAIFFGPAKGILVFCLAGCFSYIFAKSIDRPIHGYTGDTLGAGSELTEIFVLICILVIERSL